MPKSRLPLKIIATGAAALALSACDRVAGFDPDLRNTAGGFDTSDAVRSATANRPQPDERGVVSYPGYQVAIAQRGDTIGTVAARVGLPADQLARYNAIPQNVALRDGEIIALPVRVGEPGTGALAPSGNVDVATIAGTAIDRAEAAPGLPAEEQPTRHRVSAGETAFSIARTYDVPVAALAEWNGLGPDLTLREGQYLLIPVRTSAGVQVATIEAPGAGSVAPSPPSSANPLPDEEVAAAPAPEPERPAAVAEAQTSASDTARLRMPVQGSIIRPFQRGESDGIGIAASAGTAVAAADDGTVAAITRDTDHIPILVLRHEGNLLTVYAGVDDISVGKGDSVQRGQKIAEVRDADPSFLHFEVREGFDSVDPLPYLQ